MTKKLTIEGKSVEISDEDYDAMAHLGAQVGIGLYNAVFSSEAGRKAQGPSRGHPPRLAKDDVVAKNKDTAADRLHDVVEHMKKMRGQK